MIGPATPCRCGHTWADHYQLGGADAIECDRCEAPAFCEDFVIDELRRWGNTANPDDGW